jgi:hypothetical protein
MDRQWISNGIVNADQTTAPSVSFASKIGPLVNVRLHPSDIDVQCRVGSMIAGAGEAEWHPFSGGDEVLVAMPGGHERGGAVIISRLCNGVDTFPTNVCNQDVTQNNVTAKRSIPNFAWEIQNGWILRSSTTTAQLALDVKGGWMLNDGTLNFLNLSSQGATLSLAKMVSYIALDAATGQIRINAGPGKAMVTLDPAGNVYVTGAGRMPVGHVATVEGTVSLLLACLTSLGALIAPVPVTPVQVLAAMVAGIPAAASGAVPYGPLASLVNAALGLPQSDVTGQALPGLGAPGAYV